MSEKPEEQVHIPHPTDCTDQEFRTWLETATLGDASSIHNLLSQTFNQMKQVKDDLVAAVRGKTLSPEKEEEAKKTLNKDVYPMLQRIETRIFQCRERIANIQKKPL